MKKNIREVNDQEICRRLEVLMHSEKEDLNSALVKRILESQPYGVDPREVPDPFPQYVKHYFYMIRREERIRLKEGDAASLPLSAGKKRGKSVKKTPKKAILTGSSSAKKAAKKKKTVKKK